MSTLRWSPGRGFRARSFALLLVALIWAASADVLHAQAFHHDGPDAVWSPGKTDPYVLAVRRMRTMVKTIASQSKFVDLGVAGLVDGCFEIQQIEKTDPAQAKKLWEFLISDADQTGQAIWTMRGELYRTYRKAYENVGRFAPRFRDNPLRKKRLLESIGFFKIANEEFRKWFYKAWLAAYWIKTEKNCASARTELTDGREREEKAMFANTKGILRLNATL